MAKFTGLHNLTISILYVPRLSTYLIIYLFIAKIFQYWLINSYYIPTDDKIKKETEEESPESGNRDEGYSTMSSDVQGTSEIPHKTLEELKEVTDESDSVPFRLSLDTKMIRLVELC